MASNSTIIDIVTNKAMTANDLSRSLEVIYNDDKKIRIGRTCVQNYFPTCMTSSYGTRLARSVKDLINLGFIESMKDGIFYETKSLMTEYSKPKQWEAISGKPFYCSHESLSLRERLDFGMKSTTFLIPEGKKYTFGVELETNSGYVPRYIINDWNVQVVRDGSINRDGANGGEYVTGILIGDHGFHHLQKVCYELGRRCTVNQQCGLHVHIGSANFNKEFTVFSYLLALKIQKEMFKIVPRSRVGNHYCSFLPEKDFSEFERKIGSSNKEQYHDFIEIYYADIFHYLSGGRDLGSKLNKKVEHPDGKWCKPRYHWLNLIPCNFKKAGIVDGTIEFRHHSGTLNFKKVRNYILLAMAFVNYVENHKNEIVNKKVITFKDILSKAYPKRYEKLNSYFDDRKSLFTGSTADQRKSIELGEYSEDSIGNSTQQIREMI